MKRLLLILILTLSFQTLTKAEDIRDFEIEGISIGDSLLDFYSENEIQNSIDKLQSDNDYSVTLISKNFDEYEAMEFHYKTNDKSYIIEGIAGGLFFQNDFNKCLKKQTEVTESIKNSLNLKTESVYDEIIHPLDPSGKSKIYRHSFMLNTNSKFYEIGISCFNFSKEIENKGYTDNFNIIINSDKYNEHLSSTQ